MLIKELRKLPKGTIVTVSTPFGINSMFCSRFFKQNIWSLGQKFIIDSAEHTLRVFPIVDGKPLFNTIMTDEGGITELYISDVRFLTYDSALRNFKYPKRLQGGLSDKTG